MTASKDFGRIEDDYTFFMTHSTEAEAGLAAYAQELSGYKDQYDKIRMLDFGCGSGDFTAQFLSTMDWPPLALELALLEPVEDQCARAALRLAGFTARSVATAARSEQVSGAPFDLILSNHVLYYVEDLEPTLRQWIAWLAPQGMILAAVAGRDNALWQFWRIGFDSINQPVPYHTAEDVESILTQLPVSFDKKQARYRLRFFDSTENRMKILRFLLAEHLGEMQRGALLAAFDQFVKRDQIEIETHSVHFVVRPAARPS